MTDAVFTLPQWPQALGEPPASGVIKQQAHDFIVVESLPFELEKQGEHVYLQIEKAGENTEFVAKQLARLAAVRLRDIGYAGLKDRHALTTQWFSVWLPGKSEPDWSLLNSDQIKVLQVRRHNKKLKRGVLEQNHFRIVIRELQGDREQITQRLRNIKAQGFPNYFTEQRFGRNGQNVSKAIALFQAGQLKPRQSGIYYSAVRALLFNAALAQRVRQQTWNTLISGDICQLNGCQSIFTVDQVDQGLQQRAASGDIHPAGMLPGSHDVNSLQPLREIGSHDFYTSLITLLTASNLSTAYRAYRCFPQQLTWDFTENDLLSLQFALPPGSYATALIREVIRYC